MSTRTKRQGTNLSNAETRLAQELAQALSEQGRTSGTVQLRIKKKIVEVPAHAIPLIAEIMEKMGAGESVEVRTIRNTLSTAEAAEVLNVSRPYVVKLLEKGAIPYVATEGNHRRIKRADLLEFVRRNQAERRKAVDELAAEGQRLNREYELEH